MSNDRGDAATGRDRVVVVWYDRDDYPAIVAQATKTDNLPRAYEEWLTNAEHTCAALEAQGCEAVRVNVKSDQFAEWCRVEQKALDGKNRIAFAMRIARARDEA